MVASKGYYEWLNAGQPYTLIPPAAALVRNVRAHGITVFHRPNEEHLKAARPQDHTPFSVTGWPGTNARWNARGVDIMPRDDTPAARKENADLARQLIKDRNAGHPGVMWIKYLNWTDEKNICRQERWTPNHTTVSSTDKGHIHISGRSDADTDTRAEAYDPVARMNGTEGDIDMTPDQDQRLTNIEQWLVGFFSGAVTGDWPHHNGVVPKLVPNEKLNTIDTTTTALTTGGVTQDMVNAGVKAALMDPEVLAVLGPVLVEAARQGAEAAEDS